MALLARLRRFAPALALMDSRTAAGARICRPL